MSAPALRAEGLDKRFGSLVIAKDINLELPQGVRYALIGPNGAGKTTLINLITGLLRSDAGRILLENADITALAPEARVKRGLVRTLQINTLFPHLSALESVTLAVCERRGIAREWWKPLTRCGDAADEGREGEDATDAAEASANGGDPDAIAEPTEALEEQAEDAMGEEMLELEDIDELNEDLPEMSSEGKLADS